MTSFRIDIEDGHVRLGHLFIARMWNPSELPGGTQIITYKALRRSVEESALTADIELLLPELLEVCSPICALRIDPLPSSRHHSRARRPPAAGDRLSDPDARRPVPGYDRRE